MDELFHKREGVGKVQADDSTALNFKVYVDLSVVILVRYANVEDVRKRDFVAAKFEDFHVHHPVGDARNYANPTMWSRGTIQFQTTDRQHHRDRA